MDFRRGVCGLLVSAEGWELLVANGVGGQASGAIAGLLTRRYHGLRSAAQCPPRNGSIMGTGCGAAAAWSH
jgi:hypothetical protein